MRAALRHLAEHGVEALKPQKVVSKLAKLGMNTRSAEVWRRPVVSKRVGNDLRKKALREGTYGTFDPLTGIGWEPSWDLVLKSNQYAVSRFGGIRPKKLTKRERTREERAQKIEKNLESRLEKMEEYYTNKEAERVKDMSFEAVHKRMLRSGGSSGP